jgi:TatD DNase family protein
MRFIDTHCHVHFNAYKDDMHQVVQQNLDRGVGMVTVGTQSSTSENGIKLAEQFDGVWATIGLHPNHVHAQQFHDTNEIETIRTRSESFDPSFYEPLVSHPKVVAIGEFGLDYYRIPEGADADQVKAEQKAECEKQLAFATKHDKPIVIHCRDAHSDMADLLEAEIARSGIAKRGIIHSFTGTKGEADRYIAMGFKLGINGILFFSKDLQQVVAGTLLESLVLETDAPYLTPPPNRGKRNEPFRVEEVAQLIADLQKTTPDAIADQTTANARMVFGL